MTDHNCRLSEDRRSYKVDGGKQKGWEVAAFHFPEQNVSRTTFVTNSNLHISKAKQVQEDL